MDTIYSELSDNWAFVLSNQMRFIYPKYLMLSNFFWRISISYFISLETGLRYISSKICVFNAPFIQDVIKILTNEIDFNDYEIPHIIDLDLPPWARIDFKYILNSWFFCGPLKNWHRKNVKFCYSPFADP